MNSLCLADGDAKERQAAAQEMQEGRLAALTQQHGLVDGDEVQAIATHCNERKLAAKTVSVSCCPPSCQLAWCTIILLPALAGNQLAKSLSELHLVSSGNVIAASAMKGLKAQ